MAPESEREWIERVVPLLRTLKAYLEDYTHLTNRDTDFEQNWIKEMLWSIPEHESQSIVLRNAAQCIKCDDIIESTHVHDYVTCSCGECFVDGGFDYLRYGGPLKLLFEVR